MVKECDSYALHPYYWCVGWFEEVYFDCRDIMGSTVCQPVVRLPKKVIVDGICFLLSAFNIVEFKICNPLRLALMQCEIPRTIKKNVEEGYDKHVKTAIRKVVDFARKNVYVRVVSINLVLSLEMFMLTLIDTVLRQSRR